MALDLGRVLKNKTILFTGGTGSFGGEVVGKLLSYSPQKVVVFSRDEKKQFDMSNKFNDDRLKFILGDVRDRQSVEHAMHGVDMVFHAAALKQVPNCEFFPIQAIQTNIHGSFNVINAAIDGGVKNLVLLSTDKAVYPVNVMGMSKALAERVMIAAFRQGRGSTTLSGTRYGNLIYTPPEPPVVPVSDATSHDCPPWAQIVREQPYREQRKKRLSHLRGEVSVAVEFGWGSAITDICWSEYAGCWIAGNDEYGTVVRFCPWCGLDLWSLRPPEPV